MDLIKEDNLRKDELLKIYRILNAYNEGIIVNPSEDWEVDIYDDIISDKKGLDIILEKIESLLPFDECDKIKKQILRRRYDTFNNEIDESVYDKIEKAFNQRKTAEIGYFDMKSVEIKTREIDIYYKSRKYVIAYCHLRNDMRKFRTSKIVTAILTGKTYEIPKDFDKSKFL
jgi:predicted DNA-binding transcriptional regulator YafY